MTKAVYLAKSKMSQFAGTSSVHRMPVLKTLNRLILEWKVRPVTYLPSVSPGSLKMSKKTTRKVSLAQIEIMKRLLR